MKVEETQSVWILTDEYNDYDQHGEYFCGVFFEKPTANELIEQGVHPAGVAHVLNGGGRITEWDGRWFFLREVKNESQG